MKSIALLLVFTSLIFSSCKNEQKKINFVFPKPIGVVSDFEHVFTQQQIDTLTSIITKHQDKTTNQISIVTINTYAPYKKLADYSLDLFNSWGIGSKEKNNGAAIVFSKQLRQIRITVGVGLEEKLKDREIKMILDFKVIPHFQKDDYYNGIKSGLLEIIKQIEKEG